jgi:hypothetical protein
MKDFCPVEFVRTGKAKHLQVVCSIFDWHFAQHVVPFVENIKSFLRVGDTTFALSAYGSLNYREGHVALNKRDAISVIDDVVGGKLV